MVKINCESTETLKLTDMTPFQGNLKKRTPQDILALKESILNEGLMMPFAVWKHDDKNYLLDGHGRREALTSIALDNPNVLSMDFPVVYIEADTEDDARKALLQITSQYGKITKQGVKQFCVSIPDYKAPSIAKFVAKPVTQNVNTPKVQQAHANKTVIKIRVDAARVEQVKEILRQVNYIEIL